MLFRVTETNANEGSLKVDLNNMRTSMTEKTRILFLSANPWTTGRILVDEEAREVFEKLQEGPYRNSFEIFHHAATRPIDLQRLLLLHRPHIVHFSGHGNKKQQLILGGTAGRGKSIDTQGLVELLTLYRSHIRVVLLNACFTRVQAQLIAEVIDYSIGTGRGIGDRGGVAFAGAFYRALGFGCPVKSAFDSAKAELSLTKMPRTQGFELYVRQGLTDTDLFPQFDSSPRMTDGPLSGLSLKQAEETFEQEVTITGKTRSRVTRKRFSFRVTKTSAARCELPREGITSDIIISAK